jgi:hypothetical protein
MMSTRTISQAFDLPAKDRLQAMEFVARLRRRPGGAVGGGDSGVQRLVDYYVVTPAVERELPRILADMRQVFERGEEYGRFVHGSFGSGKTEFMNILALLLEGDSSAWEKKGPLFESLHGQHRAWVEAAKLLVVRIHMLSVSGRDTGIDRVIYDGFNAALRERGKAPFEFLNVEAVFTEVRRDAQEYGDVVWKRLRDANIVESREAFEALADGSAKTRERFARAWLAHKGRDVSSAGVDPKWSEGLLRMAEHAKAQGFGGVVLMIDEFLLWLGEKEGKEFVREINDLNVVVDHDSGQRAAPMFAYVARQRNLREFFPDYADEQAIHERLDHIEGRFPKATLQDIDLRHIVRGRVLKPRLPTEVAEAVAGLAERHKAILPALLGKEGAEYLRDVYPFHPVLIETLVDVTSLMQRERSALRILYELLVLHHPDLPLGEFVPVGSAFDAVFPEPGVEATKKRDLMEDIHHQYYARLRPALARMAEEIDGLDGERRRAVDQIVKTVLLGEVSPRLKGSGLTIERLVQLNSVDVQGETFRGRVRVAETDLLALSQHVPDLQIAGTGGTAVVSFVLGRVSLGEVLGRAKSKVDNHAQRLGVLWRTLKSELGLDNVKDFADGGSDGDYPLTWRKTKRRGRLKFGNVREMTHDDFEPPEGAFCIVIDYPWDDPGHTVEEDRQKAHAVRKSRGTKHTVCWLPRHMSPIEIDVVTELAAVRYLLSGVGQEELLGAFGPQDKAKLLEQAGIRQQQVEGQLTRLLQAVYVDHAELLPLISDVDTHPRQPTLAENLDHMAGVLMDRRYPKHPPFGAEPRVAELELLLEWMVNSGDTGLSVAYNDATGKALRTLGQPLELVTLGQTKASLRLDTRYIKDVLQRTDQDSVPWAPVAEHLRDEYGFTPPVINLFLCFLCRRNHRALTEPDGESVGVTIGMKPTPIRLQRGKIVDAAAWHRLRDLGPDLLNAQRPEAHRSLQAQDRFAAELQKLGRERRTVLQAVHERIVSLGVSQGGRLGEIATANERLAPLARDTRDSSAVLLALLEAWPEEGADPVRMLVKRIEPLRNALSEIDERGVATLRTGAGDSGAAAQARDHVAGLEDRLTASDVDRPVTIEWVRSWNKTAHGIIQKLVVRPVPEPPPDERPRPEPPLPAPPRPGVRVLHEARIDVEDPDAVSQFLADVRRVLGAVGKGMIRLVLRREEDDP